MTTPSRSGRQRPGTAAQRKTSAQPGAGSSPVQRPGPAATGSSPVQRPGPGATGSSPVQRPAPAAPATPAQPIKPVTTAVRQSQSGSSAARPATTAIPRPATTAPANATSDRQAKPSDRQGKSGRTGEHVPVKPGSGPRGVRQNTSDRQGGKAAARPVNARGGPTIALKMKFTLVMAGVTMLAMIVLGMAMSQTTQRFLLGQKTQSGIEIGRMATTIAQVVRDRVKQLADLAQRTGDNSAFTSLQKDVQTEVQKHLDEMRRWGNSSEYSDIEAIGFNCPELPQLSGAIVGSDNGVQVGQSVDGVFIPKLDLTLQAEDLKKAGIQIYRGQKNTDHGLVNILRFKIDLPPEFGRVEGRERQMEPANVRVDIAMSSIDKVGSNLTSTISLAVLVAIAVVIAIALWLATSITRPLERLLRDMQIVSKGRLDHRTGAASNDEVGLLAVEFNRMTSSLEEAQAAVIEQEKAAYELSLAREVQQQLLPSQPPLITGFQCQSFYQGAKAVSGDYFDFIPLGNGLWGFIIADVSGKGIPGSMVMAVTRTVVRLVAPRHGANAAETLKDTNRLIAKQIKRGMFVTSFYAVLNENTGQLTYASAGHNPMVIYRAGTRAHELATTKGIALGFNEGPVFDRTIQQAETPLGKGDTIVLYTDGFPEAMNSANEEFGEENFYKLIEVNGHLEGSSLIEAVVAGIAHHRGDAEQSDDLTMLTVRRA